MLELTTINTTELTNKKLGTQLNAIKKAVDEESTQCDTPSAYFTILELVEKLEKAELIALKEYIEKRL